MVSRQPPLHHSQRNQLRQRNTRLFIFLLIGFCLFFFLRYTSRLIEYGQEQLLVAEWQQKIEDAKLEQAKLLAHQDFVMTDAYVEEVSRRELLMARPGDTLVVVLPGEGVGASAAALGVPEGQNVASAVNTLAPSADSADTALVSNDQLPGAAINRVLPNAAVNSSVINSSAINNEPAWRQWILLFSQTK